MKKNLENEAKVKHPWKMKPESGWQDLGCGLKGEEHGNVICQSEGNLKGICVCITEITWERRGLHGPLVNTNQKWGVSGWRNLRNPRRNDKKIEESFRREKLVEFLKN